MFSLRKFTLNCLKSPTMQTLYRGSNYSSAKPTVLTQTSIDTASLHDNSKDDIKRSNTSEQITKLKDLKKNSMVAAAFASLKDESLTKNNNQKLTFYDKKITNAANVDELLAIAEENYLSRYHALKIVSTLAQWSSSGKINLTEFETDQRFIKVCRILSRNNFKPRTQFKTPRVDDLSMVLGVTGDDEAAKLVANVTLPQMVKVMSSLSLKKRRSTPLLRSLAYNISKNTSKLDLKQSADLLYSMTVLNFPEPVLLERISNDIMETLNANTDRSAVIGSILTSIGLMKYKDISLLDALSEWVLTNYEICRPQDIFSLFLTLAIVNHLPTNSENLLKVLVPQLNIADTHKASMWLDVVWSLVILNQAMEKHLLSVFDPDFIEKLHGTNGLSISSKIKLLNVNAAAKFLMKDYKGPTLPNIKQEEELTIMRSKEKQAIVSSVLDSLNSLLPSPTYLKSNVNTGLGFYLDGVCVIDKKCNPLPVDASGNAPMKSTERIMVGILVYDYHDMCRGVSEPHGGNILAERLLKAQGYKLLTVPHTEFNPRDKLVQRVQYLEKKLKSIASKA